MGCVYGKFEPTDAYFVQAQKSIWKFWANDDLKPLLALRLNVQLSNGYFLYPIGGITLDDLEELPSQPLRIDIAGLYRHAIEDYFQKTDTGQFTLAPWHQLSIKEKIALEDELEKEIRDKSGKSVFAFWKSKREIHPLTAYSVSALARDQRNDDVLFVTHKAGSDNGFAQVHLTWKGKPDPHPNFPRTTFFKDFVDFKSAVMNKDAAEWVGSYE